MSDHLDLNAAGIRLFAGRFYNHDYLWFSSIEISKTASTVPLIHNYALTYAITGFSYSVCDHKAPRYAQDLARMPAYATPARGHPHVRYTRYTQNAINSRTLRTDDAPRGTNSPALGWRLVIDPTWQSVSLNGSGSFGFYLFAQESFRPPAVTRLGKKGCPVRFEWEQITPAVALLKSEPIRPTHAVNPLDVQGNIVASYPVAIPPHLVLQFADIAQDWFVFSGEHRVHVPRRFVSSTTASQQTSVGR